LQKIANLLRKLYPFDTFLVKPNGDTEDIYSHLSVFPLQDLDVLSNLLNMNPCKVSVEIGSWTGQSTCFIATYIKEKSGKLFAIDNFKGSPGSEQVIYTTDVKETLLSNLRRMDVMDVVTILDGNSDDFVSRFEDESIDFMFIDGDHRYSQFSRDFKNWYPKIKIGGIFSGHDFNGANYEEENIEKDFVNNIHHGVSKALMEYSNSGIDLKFSNGSSIWWTVKSGVFGSLSLAQNKGERDDKRTWEEEAGVFKSVGSPEFTR